MKDNKHTSTTVFLIVLIILVMGSCTFDTSRGGHGYTSNEPIYVHVEEYDCYTIPYYHNPEWCDLFGDGECCTWYVDGWFEEWCDWGYMGCWEYHESF